LINGISQLQNGSGFAWDKAELPMRPTPTRSALLSFLLHAGAILLVLILTRVTEPPPAALRPVTVIQLDVRPYLPRAPRKLEGGGGGGARDETPASRGRLPRTALRQFTPPVARILNSDPRLTMEPTLIASPDIVMPRIDSANYGDPNGILGKLSSGRGSGGGIGDGDGGGVGDRTGPGYGDGDGGGVTAESGIRGALTPPTVLWKNEPEYTEEARKARVQGMVVLAIEVDTRGQARNIRIRQGLGLGLDERAVQSVSAWKFRPGSRNGKPVVTPAEIYVTFRLL
jgi:periplasmic protein TonB